MIKKVDRGDVIHKIESERFLNYPTITIENIEVSKLKKLRWEENIIESWVKIISPYKIWNQYNPMVITTKDEKGNETYKIMFEREYIWFYKPQEKKVLKRPRIDTFKTIEEALKYERSDKEEFEALLSQKNSSIIGEEKTEEFDTLILETIYPNAHPFIKEHVSHCYYDRNNYEIIKTKEWDIYYNNRKKLVKETSILKYEIFKHGEISDNFFKFKIPKGIDVLIDKYFGINLEQKLFSRILDLTSLPIYVLKEEILGLSLVNMSVNYNYKNLSENLIQLYVNTGIKNWKYPEDCITLHISSRMNLSNTFIPRIKYKIKMVHPTFIGEKIKVYIFSYPKYPTIYLATSIHKVDILIEADKKRYKENDLIYIIENLSRLRRHKEIINKLESQIKKNKEEVKKKINEIIIKNRINSKLAVIVFGYRE
jgi:hypothetical protein